MTARHSGAPLDGLLKIVLSQGGDRLFLETDEMPIAKKGESPLRLTVPPTSNSMLRVLCGEMASEAQAGDAQAACTFAYELEGEFFQIHIKGSLLDGGSASVLIQKGPASDTSETVDGEERDSRVTTLSPEERSSRVTTLSSEERSRVTLVEVASPSPDWTRLIDEALALQASDLHLTDGETPRARVAGALRSLSGRAPKVRSLLSETQWADVERGRSVDFGQTHRGGARLRVNAFKTAQGICAAIRLLPSAPPALETLGLPPEVLNLSRAPHGLILICGHTGAGKSTTLASFVQTLLSRSPGLCITLESPIEYHLAPPNSQSLIRQREVGTHVESFPTGLRDALREDPDLLLIGEMRDAETAALALTAAETGHLVLSSLHSRTAASTIQRIVDLFPSTQQAQVRYQLADSLRAVVSQRLLPSKHAGGRVVAAEVLTLNAAAAHHIREGKTEQLPTCIQSGKEDGMLPLERDLARLVNEGKVERGVARAAANTTSLFDSFFSSTS